MNDKQQPLVSCIMPTYNRRWFVPHAIRYFLRQDHPNKELIIVDDGDDKISDLIPGIKSIRYFQLDKKITLGAKLNMGCKYANGSILANWDDDDWYASRRLSYQVSAIQNGGLDICGINKLFYYDWLNKCGYQYTYPPDHRTWLIGSSLCYKKEFWIENNFEDINVGMDALFVWRASHQGVKALSDSGISVHLIHHNNVSPKNTKGSWWNNYPIDELQKIMGEDWKYYQDGNFKVGHTNPAPTGRDVMPPKITQGKQLRNIHACLVHENEDCIIDLVRNLHYHDPASVILLYNGGENSQLFKSDFPYENFNAVIHPNPVPVKHGYLHVFALNCMWFALQNLSFDSFTVVDSDQLQIRSGYSEYMGQFLSSKNNVGMLSSLPERITPSHTNSAVWPAIQAFKEYDLWKPFLQKFQNGESQFVHWTFWPSTVFTLGAIKDIANLFEKDRLLRQIMKESKIWASEEVVLPTLVKLLGYDIVLNPCSYEFVKYQKSYNLQQLDLALNKTDAYWIHPIERKYENELRKHTRQRFHHYSINNKNACTNKISTMLTTFSLINKIKNIEGWLSDAEADLLISITLKACKEISSPQHIVEIGSYQGKSTVLLGSVVKEYFPEAKVYAIDPHEGAVSSGDQAVYATAPTLEKFTRNIANAGLSEIVELIKNYSYNITWDKPISLLFIDGLHDYPNVARDFRHFGEWVMPGAYIAFHDYSHYYPGVQAFVDELLGTKAFNKISCADSMMIIQKL